MTALGTWVAHSAPFYLLPILAGLVGVAVWVYREERRDKTRSSHWIEPGS